MAIRAASCFGGDCKIYDFLYRIHSDVSTKNQEDKSISAQKYKRQFYVESRHQLIRSGKLKLLCLNVLSTE